MSLHRSPRAHWYLTRHARAHGALVKLAAPNAKGAKWQELAKVGDWQGHSAGAFALTREDLEAMVATYDAQENPIPFTYEHPDYRPDGSPVPAAGWVEALEVRGDSLWGLVAWTERAAKMIRDGEYQYCSIVFSHEATDRVTGDTRPELFEVGMVNRPFIDGLQPLAASAVAAAKRRLSMTFDLKKIIEALGELPKDAGPEQMHKALEAAILAQEALEKPAEEEKPEPEEAPEMTSTGAPVEPVEMSATIDAAAAPEAPMAPEDKSADAAAQVMGALEKALGLDAAGVLAFVMDNQDKLAAMVSAEPASGTPAEDAALADVRLSAVHARAESAEAKLSALNAELEVFRAERAKADEAAMIATVDAAISAGHILSSHRETFIKLGRLNRAELETELSRVAKSPAVPTGRLVTPKPVGGGSASIEAQDDAEAQIIRLLSGRSPAVIKGALEKHRANNSKLNGRA